MILEEAMQRVPDFWTRPEPKKGSLGEESDWVDFTELTISGGKMLVGDPEQLPQPEQCLCVNLPNGAYSVRAKVMRYGKDKRISRIQVSLKNGSDANLGAVIGTAGTDIAIIGICDAERIQAACEENPDECGEDIKQDAFGIDSSGVVHRDSCIIPVVSSGFGDGEFLVYELLSAAGREGAEIEFIKHNEPYPF